MSWKFCTTCLEEWDVSEFLEDGETCTACRSERRCLSCDQLKCEEDFTALRTAYRWNPEKCPCNECHAAKYVQHTVMCVVCNEPFRTRGQADNPMHRKCRASSLRPEVAQLQEVA